MKRSRLSLLPLVLVLACASEGTNQTTAAGECAAKLKWSGGNEGSASMNPGQDCVACHTTQGEGPKFAVAGTVFGNFAEPDLCQGKSGIAVEITDANGKVATLTTNEAGNFQSDSKASLVLPYTVKLRAGGKERAMISKVTNGSCNGCHTVNGKDGAPGRIVIPE